MKTYYIKIYLYNHSNAFAFADNASRVGINHNNVFINKGFNSPASVFNVKGILNTYKCPATTNYNIKTMNTTLFTSSYRFSDLNTSLSFP